MSFLYKNRYLISGAVALTIIGISLYIFKNKKENSKKNMENGNSIEEIDGIIYSYPKTKLETYSVIIVFGGINYATPKWMIKQTPLYLLSKAIFIFVPYTTPYSSVIDKINPILIKNKVIIKDMSIIGFSAGGLNVQKALKKNFKFIGLIDPSTRLEYANLPFTNNAKMVYNDANWGGLTAIKDALPKIAQSVKNGGGDAEKVNLSHAKIPSYFFNKYKDQIV